jgi:hypothetical protein
MNAERNLPDLLAAERADTGCAAGFEILHQYVEREVHGGDAEREFPALAAHLRSCPACQEDHKGLVDIVMRFGDASPSSGQDR